MNDYSRTISTKASKEVVFDALTAGFSHWWTTPEGTITGVGDCAKFIFPPGISYWTFEALELKPAKSVTLKCVEAFHIHEGQPKGSEDEWLGSLIHWQIEDKDGLNHIHMKHVGLGPALACYDICERGWNHFFGISLQAFLDTGTGMPHR